ncbi:acyl-CoA dehydrogenase family protein [Herbidospora daliensis]|uniref:acyl-CoA dehydrogenase family protein n=1 Tax=Herbidospora daliensis TaxID=295585 RepID=UPI0007866A6D|nr:acyl-CoA dehydrogenase family protein [Herbidospora daliensis]
MTATIAEFFEGDLAPLVRRMADRPRGEGGDTDDDRRETRAMVWEGLVGLGALDGDDATGLAELLGSVLYQGPLLDTLTARALFPDAGLGQAPVALAAGEPTEADGTVSARCDFVGFADEVEHFAVVGGERSALVRAGHPSITTRRHEETGRGELHRVDFAGTPVTAWAGRPDWEGARVRQAAYLVGLAQAALDHAVDYATTRRQFGRAIGANQALSFRLAEMSMRVDAARLLVHDPGTPAHAAATLGEVADLARTVTTATMQIHGAAGMRSDDDAQLYYRRAAAESVRLPQPRG